MTLALSVSVPSSRLAKVSSVGLSTFSVESKEFLGKPLIHRLTTYIISNNNNQQHRREFYDFEARDDLEARDFDYLEARDDLEARDFDYLEARDELEARDDLALEPLARQDQSGAFNFGKFLKGAVGVVSHLLRREELEMLAREEPEYL